MPDPFEKIKPVVEPPVRHLAKSFTNGRAPSDAPAFLRSGFGLLGIRPRLLNGATASAWFAVVLSSFTTSGLAAAQSPTPATVAMPGTTATAATVVTVTVASTAPTSAPPAAASPPPSNTTPAPRVPDTLAQRLAACTACHGKDGRAASDGYYPRIAGKPAGYLMNQLRNFREGRRQYPLMIYMVEHQSDAYLQEMADYFSSLHPPYPPPQPVTVTPAVLARGARLVREGDAARQVPACVACHGAAMTGVSPATPGLLGLPRDYMSAQFGAWRNGSRHAAAPDCMSAIAQRLSLADVGALAAWLAAQPLPADAAPAAAPGAAAPRLPLDCGSIPKTTGALR